jgi:hypothetical protein
MIGSLVTSIGFCCALVWMTKVAEKKAWEKRHAEAAAASPLETPPDEKKQSDG